jgi:hypothetical protein
MRYLMLFGSTFMTWSTPPQRVILIQEKLIREGYSQLIICAALKIHFQLDQRLYIYEFSTVGYFIAIGLLSLTKGEGEGQLQRDILIQQCYQDTITVPKAGC